MAATGMTLGAMLALLKSHAKLSANPGLNLNTRQEHIDKLKTNQVMLYRAHDWEGKWRRHSKALAAGQRYYDFPATCDHEMVREVYVQWATDSFLPVARGHIGADQFNAFNSDQDMRADPAQRWDYYVADNGTPQFEIWPIPASNNQTLFFDAQTKLGDLVADSDRSDLDGTLIVLFTAGELLGGDATKDGKVKLAQANAYLRALRKNYNAAGGQIVGALGGGPRHRTDTRDVRVLVARPPS